MLQLFQSNHCVAGRLLPELARMLADAIILVVGMRLGCINHALLTVAQIERDTYP